MNASFKTSYTLSNASNGVYVFVLESSLTVWDEKLEKKDERGVWELPEISDKINSDAEFLLMKVPLHV